MQHQNVGEANQTWQSSRSFSDSLQRNQLDGCASQSGSSAHVVIYCTCPGEAAAARTAMSLHELGIECVRPQRGGYGEWKRPGFPMEPFRQALFTRLGKS